MEKEMILSGTNRIDGRERKPSTVKIATHDSSPSLLGPWELYLYSVWPATMTCFGQCDPNWYLDREWTSRPSLTTLEESYDQIQGNEPKPASWVLRDMWLSQSCSPSWLHQPLDVWVGPSLPTQPPHPEEPPPSSPPPGSHESHRSQRSVTNNIYL